MLWLYETNAVLPQNRPMRTFHRLEGQERCFYPSGTSKTQRLPNSQGPALGTGLQAVKKRSSTREVKRLEIIKRQRGRNIPFYFTITPDEYIEMKKADCEIEGKESADRRAAWHRQKKSRPRDWHHEERHTKNN